MYLERLEICLDIEEKELTVMTGVAQFKSRNRNSAATQLELLRVCLFFKCLTPSQL